jgi:hypothetical protein
MLNVAVIEGDLVINTILVESVELAEQLTGKTCIAYSQNEKAEPNGTYKNGLFIPRKPNESWTLNEELNQWEPPVDTEE